MSRKLLVLAVVAVIAGASVAVVINAAYNSQSGGTEMKMVATDVAAYNMSYMCYDKNDEHFYDDPLPLANYKNIDVKLLTPEEQSEKLYVTMEDYGRLLDKDLRDGFTGATAKDGNVYSWIVKNSDGKIVYSLEVDISEKKIMTRQGVDSDEVFKSFAPKNTLMEQTKFEIKEIRNEGAKNVYSYSGYNMDPVSYDGKEYFPLALLNTCTQHDFQRAFVYSSSDKMLFEYADSKQKEECTFKYGTSEAETVNNMVKESFKKYQEKDTGKMNAPAYILEYTRDLTLFLMDNYYGLASVLGYKDMGAYLKNTTYYDKFLSEDSTERSTAYGTVLSLLNDGHTGFQGSSYLMEGGTIAGSSYSQTLLKDRTAFRQLMSGIRDTEVKKAGPEYTPTKVRYSADGTTAFFSFDSFSVANYYNDKPLTPEERLSDTYYLFVHNLNEIKDRGGVTRVVIDDSLNGGGYVLILCKLIALMSKDNNSEFFIDNHASGVLQSFTVQVDSNGDGKYDTHDCFGDDFKFYILTSSYSFSCGNAFPFYAYHNGIASVIGTRSGGGECTVESVELPFGHSIHHSSPNHVVCYDKTEEKYIGVEEGVTPQVPLSFNPYDLEKVSELLKSRENAAA